MKREQRAREYYLYPECYRRRVDKTTYDALTQFITEGKSEETLCEVLLLKRDKLRTILAPVYDRKAKSNGRES